MLTETQLRNIMIFHLKNFNQTGEKVNKTTKHSAILAEDDGLGGTVTSARIYKSLIRFSLVQNDHEDRSWPKKWLDLTVEELAPKLLDEEDGDEE